jgi:L-lactate dehydrogenase
MQFSDVDLSVGSTSKYIELQTRIPRIAVVGAGFVGSTTAYALMMSGMAVDIALIDRDLRRAEGHVNDLRDAEVSSHTTRVFVAIFQTPVRPT